MKTKLALALAITALAINAQAAIINVTHHDANLLEFYSGNTTPTAENYFFISGQGQGQSLVDITATPANDDVLYNVFWVTSTYQITDTFTLTSSGPVGFSGSHHEFRPLAGRWFFTYDNPNPVTNQVPDGGNVLVGLGAALLGVWRFKR